MIDRKNASEIALMREGGRKLAMIMDELVGMIEPGASTAEIDAHARKRMAEEGCRPAFLGYQPQPEGPAYPCAVCVSIDDESVHGMALPARTLEEGQIVTLDAGLEWQGFYADMARSAGVGSISRDAQRLIAVTEEALEAAIRQVRPGNELADISGAVQQTAEKAGFSVVRQLVGHGIGRKLHEEPQVPNFVSSAHPTVRLEPGMAIAIEPMVNAGGWEVSTLDDGWTVVTADGRLSSHAEHTVVVTEDGHEVLTRLP